MRKQLEDGGWGRDHETTGSGELEGIVDRGEIQKQRRYWRMHRVQRDGRERKAEEKQKKKKKKVSQRKPRESREGNGGATRNWGLVMGVRWTRVDEARVGS